MRNTSCIETFEELLSATSLDQWKKTAEALVYGWHFDFFLYGLRPKANSDDYVVVSTYPAAWRHYYDSERLAQWDPTVRHCATRMVPLVWTSELFVSERERRLYAEAAGFGLCTGISIPIRGTRGEIGMLSVASQRRHTTEYLRSVLPDLQLLAAYMQESYGRLADCEQHKAPRLTHRELECLRWIAVGKTAWETAKILRCSERTVNFHVSNVNAKLGVANRRHAATRALALGLISL